ncbi:MAG: hypothetical protein HQL19_06765, partial [Candidatus Omnitrophica bacterium]|nr:hypothetical protein [Candidatus Omnitrophota bacterium]
MLGSAGLPNAVQKYFAQDLLSITGELNIGQLGSYLSTGHGIGNVPLRDMGHGSFLKWFPLAVTLNLPRATDDFFGPTEKPLPTAATEPLLNIYIAGASVNLWSEIGLGEKIKAMLDAQGQGPFTDDMPHAYTVKGGIVAGTLITLDRHEADTLFARVDVARIPVGKVRVAGMKTEVPVYLVDEPQADGSHVSRILILTPAGLSHYLAQAEQDVLDYDAYTSSLSEGGYVMHRSTRAGTLDQRTPSNLLVAYSREGLASAPSAYTWDQVQVVRVALLANDMERAKEILDFYQAHVAAQKKLGSFNGISQSFNAYTGQNTGFPDVASSASLGLAILEYENRTHDTATYRGMLNDIVGWLKDMQDKPEGANGGLRSQPITSDEQVEIHALRKAGKKAEADAIVQRKYTEPNAVAYGFLTAYANATGDVKAAKAAADIVSWAKNNLWDGSFMRHGQGKETPSLDAQTRWLSALGVERFTAEFLNGDARALAAYLERIDKVFGVTVTDEHTGKAVTLLDLAEERQASARILRGREVHGVFRMGYVEGTVEFALNLTQASEFLAANGQAELARKAAERSAFLMGEVEKLKSKNGSYPDFTAEGVDVGFGRHSSLGDDALAPLVQVLLKEAGKNIFTTTGGRAIALVARSGKALTRDELTRPRVKAGVASYTEMVTRRSNMILGKGTDRLIWIDPVNGEEFVFVDQDGLTCHVVLVASTKDVEKYNARIADSARFAGQVEQALMGQGDYVNGGVLFTGLDGSRIAGLRDSKVLEALMQSINALSVQERSWIMYKNFSNFKIRVDVNGDGNMQEVIADVVFPANKSVITQWLNPGSGLMEQQTFVNARLMETKTSNGRTVMHYDANRIEVSTDSFDLNNQLVEHTDTIGYNIVDPSAVKFSEIDPAAPIIVKHRTNYADGETSIDTYGLYQQPILRVTNQFVTRNAFNSYGMFQRSNVFNNDGTLEAPVAGVLRTVNTADVTDTQRDMKESGYRTTVHSKNMLQGSERTLLLDNANFGRQISAAWTDKVDGHDFQVVSTYDYDTKFHSGRIATGTKVAVNGAVAQTLITTGFDPLSRRLTAESTDHQKGDAKTTLTWVAGQENPIASSFRDNEGNIWDTAFQYDRNEMNFTATTLKKGVVAATSEGRFINNGWVVNEVKWRVQAQDLRQEESTTVRTAFGTMLRSTTHYADDMDRQYVPSYNDQRAEVGGTGLKYDTQNNVWTPEFIYSGYGFTDGNLTRTKTELLNGKKDIVETMNGAGVLTREIDMTEQGYRRESNYDYRNSPYPYLAHSGATTIVRPDGQAETFMTSRFVSQWDHSDTLGKSGMTIELKDSLTGNIWYEEKDMTHRNRTAVSHQFFNPQGDVVGVAQALENGVLRAGYYEQRTTHDYTTAHPVGGITAGLPFYEASYNSYVREIGQGQELTFKTSRASSYDPVLGLLTVVVRDERFNTEKTIVTNAYNQQIGSTEVNASGNVTKSEQYYYAGPLRLINRPITSDVSVGSGEHAVKFGGSTLRYADGSLIQDVNTVALSKVFDAKGRQTVDRRVMVVRNGNRAHIDVREQKDNQGRVIMETYGTVDAQGLVHRKTGDAIFMNFFTGFNGASGLADNTVATYVNDKGEEVLFGMGHLQNVQDHRINSLNIRGRGEVLPAHDYDTLKERMVKGDLKVTNIFEVREETRNGNGRLLSIKTWHDRISASGTPETAPRLISFPAYPDAMKTTLTGEEQVMSAVNMNTGSYIYTFNGSSELSGYVTMNVDGQPSTPPNMQIDLLGQDANGKLVTELKPQSVDIPSMSEMPMIEVSHTWGGVYYRVFQRANELEPYNKLYFNHAPEPTYGVRITSSDLDALRALQAVDPKTESPYAVFVTIYLAPAKARIFEMNAEPGVAGKVNGVAEEVLGTSYRVYSNGKLELIQENSLIRRTLDETTLPPGAPRSTGISDALNNSFFGNLGRWLHILPSRDLRPPQEAVDLARSKLPNAVPVDHTVERVKFAGLLGIGIAAILNALGIIQMTRWFKGRYLKGLWKRASNEIFKKKIDPAVTLELNRDLLNNMLTALQNVPDEEAAGVEAVKTILKKYDDEGVFTEDVTAYLSDLLTGTSMHLPLAEFKRIVADATTLAAEGKLQVNNVDVFLIRKSIEAAVLLTVTPYFDDYQFLDRNDQLMNLTALHAQFEAAVPNVAALMPNMGGVFGALLGANPGLKEKALLITNILIDKLNHPTEPLDADDILQAVATQINPADKIWNEFVNAFSEPLGAHSLLHSQSTYEGFITKTSRLVHGVVTRDLKNAKAEITIRMKRDLIIRDIVNRYVETQFKPVVGRTANADDGHFIKYRRFFGWFNMPLKEYVGMRMAEQRLTMIRPTFVSRLVKRLLDRTANWNTVRELDKFWRTAEQTVYNNMVGAKNRKTQQRNYFIPDDMDRLFKEGVDLRRDLHLTMAQARQVLTDVRDRQLEYLRADMEAKKGGKIDAVITDLTTGFNDALVKLGEDELAPGNETEFYKRLNAAIAVLAKLDDNLKNVSVRQVVLTDTMTLDQVREAIEEYRAEMVPYLKSAFAAPEAGRINGVTPGTAAKVDQILSDALQVIASSVPITLEEAARRIGKAKEILKGLNLDTAVGKLMLYGLGAGPWGATDKYLTPETVFMQELLDRTVMAQKKLDINQTRLPLASYPMSLLGSYKMRILQDKRFWFLPGRMTWPKALWTLATDPGFFKEAGKVQGLSEPEQVRMQDGLAGFRSIMRNTII